MDSISHAIGAIKELKIWGDTSEFFKIITINYC